MQRRTFLSSSLLLGAASLTGCSGNDGVKDSDSDGMIDSEDYAPRDSSVQAKADVQDVATTVSKTGTQTTTRTRTHTPTSTPTPTPTPTSTATPSPTPNQANTLQVNGSQFSTKYSHFVEYSVDSGTVWVHPEGPSVSEFDGRELWVIAVGYPDGSMYASGSTTIDLGTSGTEFTVDLEWDTIPTGESIFYATLLAPTGKQRDELSGSNTAYLHETDAFQVQYDETTIERASTPEISDIGDEEGDSYSRNAREGEFSLSFDGRTSGQSWTVGFIIYKSAYVRSVRRDHGRERSEFVTYEMSSGFAAELAQILSEEANKNGFTEKRPRAEFIIDFVQHLPYVPDDVSTNYDDYTKFGSELLVEMGGDCEDTSILLASLLQSDPFNYDMALIQPPEHMAAGIYGKDDLPGYYWETDGRKYYYIETTGVGWGVGDLPEEYQDDQAYLIQV